MKKTGTRLLSLLLAALLITVSFALPIAAETPELVPVESVKITKVPGFKDFEWNFGAGMYEFARQVIASPRDNELPEGTILEVAFTDGTNRTLTVGSNLNHNGYWYTTADGYRIDASSKINEGGYAFTATILGKSGTYQTKITYAWILTVPPMIDANMNFFGYILYFMTTMTIKIMDLFN